MWEKNYIYTQENVIYQCQLAQEGKDVFEADRRQDFPDLTSEIY